MSSRISKKKKAFLPKTIDWFRLPEYIKSLFEAEPDNTAELLLAFDSEGQPVTVDKSTIGGGSGGVQTIVAGTGIAVDNTDPENPIVTNIGGGGTVTLTSQLTNDGSDGTSTYIELDELAPVSTSGDYNDLINLPTIPAATVAGVGITDNAGTFDLGDPAINQDIVWDLIPITVGRDLRKISITNDTDGRFIEFHQEGVTIDSERISANLSGSATFNTIAQFAVNQSLTGASEVGDVSTNDGMYVNADQILFNARNLLQIRPGNDILDPSQIGYALVKTDATGTTEWAEIVAGDSNTTEYTEAAVEPVVGEPISDAFVAANPNKLLFFFDTDNGQTWFYNRDDEGDGTWETLIYQPDPIVPLQNTYITQTGGTFQFQPIYAELDSVSYQNAADLTINFNGLFTNNTDRRHNYIINESDNVISFTSTATEFIVPAGKLAQITGKGVVRFFQYSEGATSVIVLSGDLDDATSGSVIGGSISDNQIAFGSTTPNEIEGSNNLTWDDNKLVVQATALGSPTTPFALFQVPSTAAEGIYGHVQISQGGTEGLAGLLLSSSTEDWSLAARGASNQGTFRLGIDGDVGTANNDTAFEVSRTDFTIEAPNVTTAALDAANVRTYVTKEWVQTNAAIGSFLPLTGGAMTGDVSFDENTLSNLGQVQSQQLDVINSTDGDWRLSTSVLFGGNDLEFLKPATSTSSTAYKLNASGIPADNRDLITKEYADANYAGGGSTKYNQTFVIADFVSSVLTITAATHGVGTKPLTQVYDASGSIVDIDINRNASGDVTLTVIPGNEFDGEVTIL